MCAALASLLIWTVSAQCLGAEGAPQGDKAKSAERGTGETGNSKVLAITYKPPKTGAPDLRVRSGTRGSGEHADLILKVIAPPHTGRTLEPQPTLYWYQSKPVKVSLELYVTDVKSMKTVLDRKISGEGKAGFQSFSLADSGIRLEPNKQYEWSVTAPSKNDPSEEAVAVGSIVRVEPTDAQAKAPSKPATPEEAVRLAEGGIWYDAFAAVSQLIEAEPTNPEFRALRTALLRQAELADISQ